MLLKRTAFIPARVASCAACIGSSSSWPRALAWTSIASVRSYIAALLAPMLYPAWEDRTTPRLTIDVFPPPGGYRPLADFEIPCIASTDTAARPVGRVKPRETMYVSSGPQLRVVYCPNPSRG